MFTLLTSKLTIGAVLIAALAGFYSGYEWHAGKVAQEQVDTLITLNKKLQTMSDRNNHIATLYAKESQKRKVVIREKIKQVIKYVDRDNCKLTDVGMQQLNCQLSPSTCAAKPVN